MAVQFSPMGVIVVPILKGRPASAEDFAALGEDERRSIEEKREAFMKKVLQPFGDTFLRLLSVPAFAMVYGEEAAKRLQYLQRLDNSDWVPVALKFFAGSDPTEDATQFMRRLDTLSYFLFVKI